MIKHFIDLKEYSSQQLSNIIATAIKLKKKPRNNKLKGQQLAMIFAKNSTRT